MTTHAAPDTNLAVFTAEGGFAVDVRLEAESVWLTLNQIANLFMRDKSVISRHFTNIFRAKELSRSAVVAKFATTASDGKTYQVEHFNLDAILSVGYRVNSKRGTQFRIWASGVLKDHLLKGYTLDAARLQQRGVGELQSAIDLLSATLSSQRSLTQEGEAILSIIHDYARSWHLLLAYDEDTLSLPGRGTKPKPLTPAKARTAVSLLKRSLLDAGTATDLFGLERGPQFDAILGGLEQTFDGQALYPTAQARAAHLLYFIIKDHPFADGNKRIGSFLFVHYLARHGLHRRISDTALVALALLTAQSDPKQKDLIIRLVMNLLG